MLSPLLSGFFAVDLAVGADDVAWWPLGAEPGLALVLAAVDAGFDFFGGMMTPRGYDVKLEKISDRVRSVSEVRCEIDD